MIHPTLTIPIWGTLVIRYRNFISVCRHPLEKWGRIMGEDRESVPKRKRVRQLRKRGIDDRSLSFAQNDLEGRSLLPGRRRLPQVEDRLDAVLSIISLTLGFAMTLGLFFYFSGKGAGGILALLAFLGIMLCGIIDIIRRKKSGGKNSREEVQRKD